MFFFWLELLKTFVHDMMGKRSCLGMEALFVRVKTIQLLLHMLLEQKTLYPKLDGRSEQNFNFLIIFYSCFDAISPREVCISLDEIFLICIKSCLSYLATKLPEPCFHNLFRFFIDFAWFKVWNFCKVWVMVFNHAHAQHMLSRCEVHITFWQKK